MALEINCFLLYNRTANTADFKNPINPKIPKLQSASIINAPPISSILNYMFKNLKSAWTKKIKTVQLSLFFTCCIFYHNNFKKSILKTFNKVRILYEKMR